MGALELFLDLFVFLLCRTCLKPREFLVGSSDAFFSVFFHVAAVFFKSGLFPFFGGMSGRGWGGVVVVVDVSFLLLNWVVYFTLFVATYWKL
ncbi:BTE_collapsed_G0004410.mRNA.1.CDS.1 [Saccharomyces cerevisiae]|nr:BTE_collapsed_G0004410.mRNA.1.CDS.1 [Saccharomyces cerevisiae]